MSETILNNLTAHIEAKTAAALAELDNLDRQIVQAIEKAEHAALERIRARLGALLSGTVDRLAGFEIRLGEALGEALGNADQILGRTLNQIVETVPTGNPTEATETADQPQDLAQQPEDAERLERQETEPEQAEQPREEPAALPVAHAHAVVTDEGLAVLPDVPTTSDPEGLHAREEVGNGRGRYHCAESPTPGEVYFRRDHRRHWNPVRFTPESQS